jgi:prepilin peptidase CpaA
MPPLSLAWAYGVLCAVLAVCAVTDVWKGKIYNAVTYPAVAAGLIGHAVIDGMVGYGEALGLDGALAGLLVGFGPMFVAWRAGGIGGGDAKLMAAVGALTGWRFALSALFCGLLVSALMAVGVMIRRRIALRTLGRIWRFLYLALTPTRPSDPAVAGSPKVPFGLALCIGSGAALVDRFLGGPMAARLLGI